MKTRALKTMTGFITIAQEGRFKMEPETGQPMLFILSPSAPIEPQYLGDLQRAQARLTVWYEESPNLIAGIVHDIGWPEPTEGWADPTEGWAEETKARR
jgi:hypothetical protein